MMRSRIKLECMKRICKNIINNIYTVIIYYIVYNILFPGVVFIH